MSWNICPFLRPSCESYPLVPAWPLEWSHTNSTHPLHDSHWVLGYRVFLQARNSDFVSITQSSSVFQSWPTLCYVGHLMFVCECGEEGHTYGLSFWSFYIVIHLLSAPASHLTSSPPIHESDPLHSSSTDLNYPKHISASGPLHMLLLLPEKLFLQIFLWPLPSISPIRSSLK